MAKLLKSGARKALAEGQLSLSWGSGLSGLTDDANYRLRLSNETHSFNLELKPKECLSFLNWFAGRETHKPALSWEQDKRTLPERLRALADQLEEQAELQKAQAEYAAAIKREGQDNGTHQAASQVGGTRLQQR